MPKFSIITPCYNSEMFIGQTIKSIQAQTLSDWEHIIVDDGSTDNSPAVVEDYLKTEPRLRLVRQENGKCARARNTGFQSCSPDSDYLFFFDADDCLEPQMLEAICGYLDTNPEVGMVHVDFNFMDADGQVLPAEASGKPWAKRRVPTTFGFRALMPEEVRTPFSALFVLAGIIPSLAVFRRSVYELTPGWDEDMAMVYEDVSLYLHMGLRSEVHYFPHKLVRYRIHTQQDSSHENSANAERFFSQERKLYAKWQHVSGLTPAQSALVQEARRFREGRIVAFSGFKTGSRHLSRGELQDALRFYGGAVRRYLASFLPVEG